jgi:P27 family predicted phage terminase small subunit
MRGRKATPTALKIVTGNPGHRPLNEDEPKFKEMIPECPLELDEVGKKKWDEKVQLLFDAGVMTEGDNDTLAIYCENWAEIDSRVKDLHEMQRQLKDDAVDDGIKVALHKNIDTIEIRLNQLKGLHVTYSALLGLDPANRGKIKVNKNPNEQGDSIFD